MNKKSLLIIIVLILTLLLVVACDNNANNPEEEVTPGEYETASYVVKYDSNGGTKNASWIEKTFVYGEKITKPTYTPVKLGYVFKYWSTSKTGAEFDFANSFVSSDITLYATYQADTVQHQYDLTAVLKKDGDSYIVETGKYTYASMPQDSTILQTQYANSSSTLAIPYTVGAPKVDNADDGFCFWYYLKDNKPVRFSTIATSTSASVAVLEAYNSTEPLTLYPMWLSTLAKVKVTFKDSLSEMIYGTIDGYYNSAIDISLNPIKTKGGYDFNKWTYTDPDGDEIEFNFQDDLNKIEDATTVTDMVDYDYFNEKSITVYANWTKLISIDSVARYDYYYELLRKGTLSDAEKKEIEEFLSATIEITKDLDFENSEYEALFDENHIFTGKIVGNKEGDTPTISNGIFKGENEISILGNIKGKVKNLIIKDPTYKIEGNNADVFIGGLVSNLLSSSTTDKGSIEGCTITIANLNFDSSKNISFGGIAYSNIGTIQGCKVTISSITVEATNFIFGGVASKNKPTASLLQNKIDIIIDSIDVTEKAKIGGIATSNAGTISTCESNINIKAIEAIAMQIGGLAVDSSSIITKNVINITLGTESNKINAKGTLLEPAQIGGILANNSGSITNCHVTTDFNIAINTDVNFDCLIGGIVGDNKSISTSSEVGAIKTSYSLGKINVIVDNNAKVKTYVGGITGRNSQNGVTCVFTEEKIDVVNNNGSNYVGFLIGDNTSSSDLARTIVSDSATLKKSGVAYTSEETEVLPNEKVLAHGDLCRTDIIFGDTTDALKFDNTIWQIITEETTLPTLKWEK